MCEGGEGTNTLYVGLCGILSIDMAVYLGQILNNLNRRVLIADLTGRQGLPFLFSGAEQFPITYRKVDYIGSEFHMYAEDNQQYDVILVCLNGNIRQLTGNRLSKLYYISDSDYTNLRQMLLEIRNARLVTGLIFRDMTDNGITASYLLKCVCMDDYLGRICAEGRVYEIPDDLVDREYRIAMQYGEFVDFRHLSSGYLRVLEKLALDITGCGQNLVKKAVKYAKEGKYIEEHHVLEQRVGKKRN